MTYESGDEICFASDPRRGVDIVNVTDKLNVTTISLFEYPHRGYTHQGMLQQVPFIIFFCSIFLKVTYMLRFLNTKRLVN